MYKWLLVLAIIASVITINVPSALALSKTPPETIASTYYCGAGKEKVPTSIDFGCEGRGNPIMDALFAIIKLLSDGVGMVVVASLIWAGIQYTSSRGDPQATAASKKRMQSNITALLIFIFAYAFLNYLVPGQLLK